MVVPEIPKEEGESSLPQLEGSDTSPQEEYQQVTASYGLSLVLKLKIADRPVKKMATTRIGEEDLLLTCAGSFSEEESLLLWRKEPISGLWINDPVPALPAQGESQPQQQQQQQQQQQLHVVA